MRARIIMVSNDSSSLVRFSNFFEDLRQTNYGVALRMECPTMLKWNSRHMGEETGNHLIRSDFSTKTFRWVWFGSLTQLVCIGPRLLATVFHNLIHSTSFSQCFAML